MSAGTPQVFIHGSKLKRKAASDATLEVAIPHYERWRAESLKVVQRDAAAIQQLTKLLNEYKDAVEPTFDARSNSAQEILQPSILEEFFEYVFSQISKELKQDFVRRPTSAYLDLVFNPRDVKNLMTKPDFTVRRKDHDFVIGASVELTLRVADAGAKVSKEEIVVPAVAIECKRYLERNMLDECSGTAERMKRVTPYCLYVVVAEFLKLDDASPELSRIDEIYVLRKQRNLERNAVGFVPSPIDAGLVWDLYQLCLRHLTRIWWDPASAVTTGKVFNFATR